MVLAAAVVLSLLATALLAASKNWQNAGLGDLSQYYETGNSADPGYVCNGKYSPGYGSNFNATWRSVADDYPDEFMQSQKDYWETHAYADLLKNIKSAVPSFDLDDYSVALRNVFWSRSVHHGAGVIRGASSSDGRSGATGVILRAASRPRARPS